jgi:hypothetical protein
LKPHIGGLGSSEAIAVTKKSARLVSYVLLGHHSEYRVTYPITLCPILNRVTLEPSCTTVPATSSPRMNGNLMCGGRALSWLFNQKCIRLPVRTIATRDYRHHTIQSAGLTAAYATLITTSSSDGSGVGADSTTRGFAFSAGSQAARLVKVILNI